MVTIVYNLLTRDKTRVDNVYQQIHLFKKKGYDVKIFESIDWKLHWEHVLRFFNYFKIPIYQLNRPHNLRGKFARITTLLMSCKYVYDMDEPIILLEDDVKMPDDFHFDLETIQKYEMLKLSRCGEGFYFTKPWVEKFFNKIYTKPLNKPEDMYIIKQMKPNKILYIKDEHLICPTSKGNIMRSLGAGDILNTNTDNKIPYLNQLRLFNDNDKKDRLRLCDKI